jgi:hypothetical protein
LCLGNFDGVWSEEEEEGPKTKKSMESQLVVDFTTKSELRRPVEQANKKCVNNDRGPRALFCVSFRMLLVTPSTVTVMFLLDGSRIVRVCLICLIRAPFSAIPAGMLTVNEIALVRGINQMLLVYDEFKLFNKHVGVAMSEVVLYYS